ncbi:host cell division inhibitor Icd-like protein [Klebsiella pneumoniae]|nr:MULTISPECIES: host cell division inhibitor Icd-like protein [Klebsiella]MDU1440119.1 host cell division inhibitor Icd-like protein [Klebsiella pneumoniae]SVP75699.1 fructokinase [Klebsiella pneumoniae]
MILRKSAFQSKGLSLAGLSGDISCNSSVMDNKFLSFYFGVKRDPTVAGFAPSTLATSTRTREGEFCESIKKGLPTIANPVYGYSAPAKSGAGIGVPVIIRAHNTRHACFFVPRSYTPSMVDCMGAEQSAPVSLIPGYANPVQFTTSEIGVSGGGYQDHESEAAYMLATTPTQNPQFIWLIAAVRRDMPTITAKIHHIAAETEQEARRILARDHVCFFAGRIRTGGAHA